MEEEHGLPQGAEGASPSAKKQANLIPAAAKSGQKRARKPKAVKNEDRDDDDEAGEASGEDVKQTPAKKKARATPAERKGQKSKVKAEDSGDEDQDEQGGDKVNGGNGGSDGHAEIDGETEEKGDDGETGDTKGKGKKAQEAKIKSEGGDEDGDE